MTDYVKIIVILISHFQHFSTSSLLDSFPSPHYLRRFPPRSYTRSSVCECVSECARMYVSPTPNQVSSHAPISLSRKLRWENFSPLSLLDPHPCLRAVNVSVYCHRSQSWSSIVSASWLFTRLFLCAFHSLVNRKQRERERGRRFRHQIVAGVTSEGRYAGKVNKCSSNYFSVFSVLWKVSATKHWRSHRLCWLPLLGWDVTTQEVGHSYPCPCLHTSKISESVQIVHRSLLFGTAFCNDSHICYTAISS